MRICECVFTSPGAQRAYEIFSQFMKWQKFMRIKFYIFGIIIVSFFYELPMKTFDGNCFRFLVVHFMIENINA